MVLAQGPAGEHLVLAHDVLWQRRRVRVVGFSSEGSCVSERQSTGEPFVAVGDIAAVSPARAFALLHFRDGAPNGAGAAVVDSFGALAGFYWGEYLHVHDNASDSDASSSSGDGSAVDPNDYEMRPQQAFHGFGSSDEDDVGLGSRDIEPLASMRCDGKTVLGAFWPVGKLSHVLEECAVSNDRFAEWRIYQPLFRSGRSLQ